jgi:predicted Fe-Mo cluster-binding NifX family protein
VEENKALRNSYMKKGKKNSGDEAPVVTRVLVPLLGDDVAPRFDLASEVFICAMNPGGGIIEDKTIILTQASAEALCHLTISEKVNLVVCCGIEEEYFQYLIWKSIKVIDSVMGSYLRVLEKVKKGTLREGEILLDSRMPSLKKTTDFSS